MRVLLSSSRTWKDWRVIWADLDADLAEAQAAGEEFVLVHGHCPRGGDAHADAWGRRHEAAGLERFRVERHPADWKKHGSKRAGGIRNRVMVETGVDKARFYIHDDSDGATGCLKLAHKLKVPVIKTRRKWGPWEEGDLE